MRSPVTKALLPEESLLSILAIESSYVDKALDLGLRPEMFEGEEATALFRAMCQAAALEQATDEFTVFQYLEERTEAMRAFMAPIFGSITTSLNFTPLVEELMGRWRRRQLAQSAKLIDLKLTDVLRMPEQERWDATKETVEPLLEKMVNVLNDVQKEVTIKQQAESAWAEIEQRLSGRADAGGLSSGFPAFDEKAYKIRPFELWILAAGTSVGKTAMACGWANRLEQSNKNAAFFTLEMGAEEIIERIAIQRCGIRWSDVAKHPANKAELKRAVDGLKDSRCLRIYDGLSHLEQIEAKCRLLKSAGKLDAIIIDYLQLIEPPKDTKKERRDVQVGAISRRLKRLARTLRVPVQVLSQFNRDFLKEKRPPQIYDLRESGSLEQDADRIWLLHMPPTRKDESEQNDESETVEIIVDQGKCRGGPRPSARLVLNRPTYTFSWFVDPAPAETQPDLNY